MGKTSEKMKKLIRNSFAFAVAGSLVMSSGGVAFAETIKEDYSEHVELTVINEPQTEATETETDTDKEQVNESVTNENDSNEDAVQELQEENKEVEDPSVLPGDFFYFAKLAIEKIRLAFTFDDEKEAKLLAEFAAERLAEAEALFAAGEEEKALETIEAALKYFEGAEEIIDENSEEMEKDGDNNSQVETEDNATEGQGDDKAVNEEEEAAAEKKDDAYEEAEELVSQNIIALKAAMEKVKNPVAKAALQKNIEKSYQKLAQKMEKWEKKVAIDSEKGQSVEDESKIENPVSEDTQGVNQSPTEVNTKTDVEGDKSINEIITAKEIKEQYKSEKKESKQAMKEERKAAKEEAKQAKKEAKAMEKENKENMKAEANKKNNNSGKENNKGKNNERGNSPQEKE